MFVKNLYKLFNLLKLSKILIKKSLQNTILYLQLMQE